MMKKITIEFDDDGNYRKCDFSDFTLTGTIAAGYDKIWDGAECIGFFDTSHHPSCFNKEGTLVCQTYHVRFQLFNMDLVKAAKMNKVKGD